MEPKDVGRGFSPGAVERRLEELERELRESSRVWREANGRLEKANRRLSRVSLILGAGIILLFALAADQPSVGAQVPAPQSGVQDVIRAKRLEMVDDAGKARIALETLPSGGARVALYDEKGALRAILAAAAVGPGLVMFDEKGQERADLHFLEGPNEGPALLLFDEKGQNRATLSTSIDQSGLDLFDDKGQQRVFLSVESGPGSVALGAEGPVLQLTDGPLPRVQISAFQDGPFIALTDKKQKTIWRAPK